MYASSTALDFDLITDFEETNHGKQWVAFDKVENGKLHGFIISRKEEVLPIVYTLDNRYISAEDFSEYKKGDLVQVDFEFVRELIYEEVEDKDDKAFKGKGKYANTGNKGTFKTIKGNKEEYICVGLSNHDIGAIKEIDKLTAEEESAFDN